MCIYEGNKFKFSTKLEYGRVAHFYKTNTRFLYSCQNLGKLVKYKSAVSTDESNQKRLSDCLRFYVFSKPLFSSFTSTCIVSYRPKLNLPTAVSAGNYFKRNREFDKRQIRSTTIVVFILTQFGIDRIFI